MKLLKIKTIGTSWSTVREKLSNSVFIGYEIPSNQNLECAWEFRLYSEKGIVFVFCSEVTCIDGWEEVGFLNVSCSEIGNLDRRLSIYTYQEVEPFIVSKISVVENVDSEYLAECGIQLLSDVGEPLLIVTSPAPGAVSVKAPFSDEKFSPEIALKFCTLTNR